MAIALVVAAIAAFKYRGSFKGKFGKFSVDAKGAQESASTTVGKGLQGEGIQVGGSIIGRTSPRAGAGNTSVLDEANLRQARVKGSIIGEGSLEQQPIKAGKATGKN